MPIAKKRTAAKKAAKKGPFAGLFSGVEKAKLQASRLGAGEHYVRVDDISVDHMRDGKPLVRISATVLQSSNDSHYPGEEVSSAVFSGDFFDREMKRLVTVLFNVHPDEVTNEMAMEVAGVDADGNAMEGDEANPAANMCLKIMAKEQAKKKTDDENPGTYVNITYDSTLSGDAAVEILGEEVVNEYFGSADEVVYAEPDNEEED